MRQPEKTIDDLPEYSPWPARLIAAEPWSRPRRAKHDIHREFGVDKWGVLLERVRAAGRPITSSWLDDLSRSSLPSQVLVSSGTRLRLLSGGAARSRYAELVASELRRFLPASAMVELGAGYGAILLTLARRSAFRELPMYAGEPTESGRELLSLLAAAQGARVRIGQCNFIGRQLANFRFPPGAIIYTSYALHYVRRVTRELIERLAACRPKAVVHFEPCFEHFSRQSILGMLRRRYLEANRYACNIASELVAAEAAGLITIIRDRRAIYGLNPLLPASVIAWTPVLRSRTRIRTAGSP